MGKVEWQVAKVGVEGSNPFARSSLSNISSTLRDAKFGVLSGLFLRATTGLPPINVCRAPLVKLANGFASIGIGDAIKASCHLSLASRLIYQSQ